MFVTSAPNRFVYKYDAEKYKASKGAGSLSQKTYLCSNDVSIQYVYWEVVNITNCSEFFADFLATVLKVPPFGRFRFATRAEAQATINPANSGYSVQAFPIFCDIGDERKNYIYYQVVDNSGSS